jgi:broad specificity phosphatase PhoE
MSRTALDLAPAGEQEHRFFLAPLRHTKTLYLIRHGEGYHNFYGEKDHENYKSEKFFDAHLNPKGWAQCMALRKHLERATTHDGAESLLDRIECVVVSPLMRALETAVGSLGGDHLERSTTDAPSDSSKKVMMLATTEEEGVRPGHPAIAHRVTRTRAPLPFLACELCREHIGLNPCDRRRKTSEYKMLFPGVDFSEVVEEDDVLWGTVNEDNEAMCARAHRFMEWIMKRPEQHVAVVTHSAFMAAMLREFGATDQLGCAEAVQLETRRWLRNCEVRPMVVVDPSGGGGIDPMFFAGGETGVECVERNA